VKDSNQRVKASAVDYALIASSEGRVPRILIARFRLYARTCKLISVLTSGSWLSGRPDLSRLSPAQIDRLEQGFQQAISDDGRLHRMYIYLDDLYAVLPK